MDHSNTKPSKSWRSNVELLLSIVIAGAAIALVWMRYHDSTRAQAAARPEPKIAIPAAPVSISGAVLKGSQRAAVVLLEFSDFECPYCGQFARTSLPTIIKEYVDTGRV